MKTFIKFLKDTGKHKAGDILEVEKGVADAYIASGVAEDATEAAKKALADIGAGDLTEAFKGLATSLREGLEATAAEIKKGVGGVAIQSTEAEADKKKSLADFVVNVQRAADTDSVEAMQEAQKRLKEVYGVKKGAEEATGTAGGYWTVPTEYANLMLKESWDESIVLPKSTNVPLGAKSIEITALDQSTIPTPGNSAEFAGITVSRKDEKTRRDPSQAKGKKIKLEAKDLTAFTSYSRDLDQDSAIAQSTFLTGLIGGAIGFRREWEHLWGTGGSMCLGILDPNNKARIDVLRKTAGTLSYYDPAKMISRLTPSAAKRAFFMAHPFHLETLLTLKDESGRLIYVPTMTTTEGPIATNPVGRLSGLPVFFNEKMAAPGSFGDFVLIDAKAYLTGQRSGLEIGMSEHFFFDTDQIALRAKIRDDGQPWLNKPFPLADGSGAKDATKQNYVSPFVGLKAETA